MSKKEADEDDPAVKQAKMPYVFGSSTPRELSYLDNIPARYRVYNVKMRSSMRRSRAEERSLQDYMRECRNPSPPRKRDRSVDNARYFVFGSSTPRDLSYLERVPHDLRIYDVKLGASLVGDKRSKTTSFGGSGGAQQNGNVVGRQQNLRRTSSMSSTLGSSAKVEHTSPPPTTMMQNKRGVVSPSDNQTSTKSKARHDRTRSVPASARQHAAAPQPPIDEQKRKSRPQTTSKENDAKQAAIASNVNQVRSQMKKTAERARKTSETRQKKVKAEIAKPSTVAKAATSSPVETSGIEANLYDNMQQPSMVKLINDAQRKTSESGDVELFVMENVNEDHTPSPSFYPISTSDRKTSEVVDVEEIHLPQVELNSLLKEVSTHVYGEAGVENVSCESYYDQHTEVSSGSPVELHKHSNHQFQETSQHTGKEVDHETGLNMELEESGSSRYSGSQADEQKLASRDISNSPEAEDTHDHMDVELKHPNQHALEISHQVASATDHKTSMELEESVSSSHSGSQDDMQGLVSSRLMTPEARDSHGHMDHEHEHLDRHAQEISQHIDIAADHEKELNMEYEKSDSSQHSGLHANAQGLTSRDITHSHEVRDIHDHTNFMKREPSSEVEMKNVSTFEHISHGQQSPDEFHMHEELRRSPELVESARIADIAESLHSSPIGALSPNQLELDVRAEIVEQEHRNGSPEVQGVIIEGERASTEAESKEEHEIETASDHSEHEAIQSPNSPTIVDRQNAAYEAAEFSHHLPIKELILEPEKSEHIEQESEKPPQIDEADLPEVSVFRKNSLELRSLIEAACVLPDLSVFKKDEDDGRIDSPEEDKDTKYELENALKDEEEFENFVAEVAANIVVEVSENDEEKIESSRLMSTVPNEGADVHGVIVSEPEENEMEVKEEMHDQHKEQNQVDFAHPDYDLAVFKDSEHPAPALASETVPEIVAEESDESQNEEDFERFVADVTEEIIHDEEQKIEKEVQHIEQHPIQAEHFESEHGVIIDRHNHEQSSADTVQPLLDEEEQDVVHGPSFEQRIVEAAEDFNLDSSLLEHPHHVEEISLTSVQRASAEGLEEVRGHIVSNESDEDQGMLKEQVHSSESEAFSETNFSPKYHKRVVISSETPFVLPTPSQYEEDVSASREDEFQHVQVEEDEWTPVVTSIKEHIDDNHKDSGTDGQAIVVALECDDPDQETKIQFSDSHQHSFRHVHEEKPVPEHPVEGYHGQSNVANEDNIQEHQANRILLESENDHFHSAVKRSLTPYYTGKHDEHGINVEDDDSQRCESATSDASGLAADVLAIHVTDDSKYHLDTSEGDDNDSFNAHHSTGNEHIDYYNYDHTSVPVVNLVKENEGLDQLVFDSMPVVGSMLSSLGEADINHLSLNNTGLHDERENVAIFIQGASVEIGSDKNSDAASDASNSDEKGFETDDEQEQSTKQKRPITPPHDECRYVEDVGANQHHITEHEIQEVIKEKMDQSFLEQMQSSDLDKQSFMPEDDVIREELNANKVFDSESSDDQIKRDFQDETVSAFKKYEPSHFENPSHSELPHPVTSTFSKPSSDDNGTTVVTHSLSYVVSENELDAGINVFEKFSDSVANEQMIQSIKSVSPHLDRQQLKSSLEVVSSQISDDDDSDLKVEQEVEGSFFGAFANKDDTDDESEALQRHEISEMLKRSTTSEHHVIGEHQNNNEDHVLSASSVVVSVLHKEPDSLLDVIPVDGGNMKRSFESNQSDESLIHEEEGVETARERRPNGQIAGMELSDEEV